jgi:hypothetical protein
MAEVFLRHPCRNGALGGYVETGPGGPDRGSRAWTSPWTGKKTPAHRLAHPPPLFHIPTGERNRIEKNSKSKSKSEESNIPV